MIKDNHDSTCPFCKEEIKDGAIKCKHCGSKLASPGPDHKGTCPYCKESIKVDAIKCKHCKSNLSNVTDCNCNETSGSEGTEDLVQLLMLMSNEPMLKPILINKKSCHERCDKKYPGPENKYGRRFCHYYCDTITRKLDL
ncbi:double zinc ribbon domain-containing protein [Vibrio sp. FJH11]